MISTFPLYLTTMMSVLKQLSIKMNWMPQDLCNKCKYSGHLKTIRLPKTPIKGELKLSLVTSMFYLPSFPGRYYSWRCLQHSVKTMLARKMYFGERRLNLCVSRWTYIKMLAVIIGSFVSFYFHLVLVEGKWICHFNFELMLDTSNCYII